MLGTREDVGDLLAMTDVLLLASRSEGMPGCASKRGWPAFPSWRTPWRAFPRCSNMTPHRHRRPPGDTQGLAEGIHAILSDPELRVRLGDAARVHCRRFDISIVAPTYRALYEEIAA